VIEERLVLKKTAIEKINELAAALMEMGTLIAPVQEAVGANFKTIENPQEVSLDFYNTVLSPKFVFFPQTENFLSYQIAKPFTNAEPAELEITPVFLFGVRPCDTRSFAILDRHFEASSIVDPYWRKRRENATIFGYAFALDTPPDNADFYSMLGIHAADTEGSDIFMVRNDRELLLKSITSKGEQILSKLTLLQETSSDDENYYTEYLTRGREYKTRTLCLEQETAAGKFEEIFYNSDFWGKTASACLSCGICTFVCPTCYCFDICDETMFKKGTRRRVWDSCMFTDFTLEASGHNPRTNVFQRLRQKVCHKYSYSPRKYDVISCVGCGRCVRSCPVNIDIYSIVSSALKI